MSEERWLTYAELGQELGISVEAARSLVRRHKWSRRVPNEYGAPTRVLVPEDRLRPPTDRKPDRPDHRLPTAFDMGSTGGRPRSDPAPIDQEVDRAVDQGGGI